MILVTLCSYYACAFLLLALVLYQAVRQNVRDANRAFNKLEAALLSWEQAQQLLQLEFSHPEVSGEGASDQTTKHAKA